MKGENKNSYHSTVLRFCNYTNVKCQTYCNVLLLIYFMQIYKHFNIKSLQNFLIYVYIPNLENTNNGSPMVTVAVLLHTS